MPTSLEFQDLSVLRLDKATALYSAGRYDGCVYLCGYVVEMALKAVICKHLVLAEYPQRTYFKVHDYDDLVLFAGLSLEVRLLTGRRKANWQVLTEWESILRYKPRNSYNRVEAERWLDALREPNEGILVWLQRKW